ncbi:MAG: hypothetical protein CM15mV89_1040 [Caudoviricetes sp.]|nr:MAG: hypothetical protein CM15mV89_1040 [Caudoviricetes sp.]
MSLIGTTDAAAFSQSVGVVNGDATVTKNAADTVVGGDVLEISGVNYIVKTVTSGTSIELHKAYAGATATVANTAVIKRTPPKHVAEFVILGGDSNSYELIFADSTEGSLAESKSRGISNPGWWLYRTYTDHYGNTRHKAECIAAMSVAAGTSGDASDDTIAADVASSVTIGTQLLHLHHLLVQEHLLFPHQQQEHLAHLHISGSVKLHLVSVGRTSLLHLIQVLHTLTSQLQLLHTVDLVVLP